MKKIKVVVPVSGGKDSQSCLKLALESYHTDEVLGLFCDTKFEHPKTYKHIDWMAENYGIHIEKICAGSVEEKCEKYLRFPGGGARHCTEELKLIPAKNFYKKLAEKIGSYEVWLGMRVAESNERKERYENKIDLDLYPPHEILKKFPKYLHKMGVMFRLPILYWTSHQVLAYLNGAENPLYAEGFDRVGCFPCLASGDKWKEKAFAHDDFGRSQRIKVANIEKKIGVSVFTSKGGCQRNNENQITIFDDIGCGVCSI